jgi:succinate dehydrogenase cytochrome B subunit, b558 family
MEPLLAAGFIFHIVYATIITVRNRRHRPISYAVRAGNHLSSWSSKNMYILGFALLLFLGLHIWNFFYRFRYTTMPETVVNGVTMDDSYSVVAALFHSSVIYCLVYVLAGLILALHLSHGFWSAFQTVGWNNLKWIPRLRIISILFAVLVGVGFAIIPLYFLVR